MKILAVIITAGAVLVLLSLAERAHRARKNRKRDARLAARLPVPDEVIGTEIGVDPKIVKVVREALARATGIADPLVILPEDRLLDLHPFGFDDVGIVDFVMEVEERLRIKLPDKSWEAPRTVRDVLMLLASS